MRPACKQLERTIGALGAAHATNVVRAFSYFHHLANAAEDLHARARAQPERGDDRAWRCERLRGRARADAQDRRVLRARAGRAGADRAPDGGAAQEHPRSPPRRSSTCCAARGDDAGRTSIEKALRREVLLLWKTNELRLAKPTVADEIENGLAYFRSTFLEAIPRLYAEIEDGLGSGDAPGALPARRELDRRRSRRQPARHRRGDRARGRAAGGRRVRALPGRDPRAGRRAVAVDALRGHVARAAGAGGALARSRHQPRRGAVPARAGRHLRARRRDARGRWTSTRARAVPAAAPARPYADPAELPADLRRHRDARWPTTAPALAADGRLRNLHPRRRACSASISARSICASTAGSTSASCRELLARATGPPRLRDARRARAPGAAAARAAGRRGRSCRRTSATARRPPRRWRRWRRPRACAPASATARSRTTSSR